MQTQKIKKNDTLDMPRMRVAITDARMQNFCRTKDANNARHAQQNASR